MLNSIEPLDQGAKGIDGEAGLTDYRPQRPFRNFLVIWNNQAPVGWDCLTQDHVTTILSIEYVPNLSQSPHRVTS